MKTFLWIVGAIIILFVWAYYSGYKREIAYREVINDLRIQLMQDPIQFFSREVYFGSTSDEQLLALMMEKVITLSLKRNIRSTFNANIIPSDINTLVDARADFYELYAFARSIVE